MRDIQFESLTGIPRLRDEDTADVELIDPVRGDPLVSVFVMLAGLRPFRVAVVVLLAQYGTILAALLAVGGITWTDPVNQTLDFESVDHLNLMLLVPLGAALLCHLYRQIRATFLEIEQRRIVATADRGKLEQIRTWAQGAYDARLPVMICLFLSGVLNGLFIASETTLFDLVLVPGDPITAQTVVLVYARLWVCANYLIIFLLFYRCAITVVALHRITRLELNVEPMHPDQAGGLSSLGALSMAVTYFLSLVMVFLAVMAVSASRTTRRSTCSC